MSGIALLETGSGQPSAGTSQGTGVGAGQAGGRASQGGATPRGGEAAEDEAPRFDDVLAEAPGTTHATRQLDARRASVVTARDEGGELPTGVASPALAPDAEAAVPLATQGLDSPAPDPEAWPGVQADREWVTPASILPRWLGAAEPTAGAGHDAPAPGGAPITGSGVGPRHEAGPTVPAPGPTTRAVSPGTEAEPADATGLDGPRSRSAAQPSPTAMGEAATASLAPPKTGTHADAHGNDAHGNDAHGNDAHANDAHANDAHRSDAHSNEAHRNDARAAVRPSPRRAPDGVHRATPEVIPAARLPATRGVAVASVEAGTAPVASPSGLDDRTPSPPSEAWRRAGASERATSLPPPQDSARDVPARPSLAAASPIEARTGPRSTDPIAAHAVGASAPRDEIADELVAAIARSLRRVSTPSASPSPSPRESRLDPNALGARVDTDQRRGPPPSLGWASAPRAAERLTSTPRSLAPEAGAAGASAADPMTTPDRGTRAVDHRPLDRGHVAARGPRPNLAARSDAPIADLGPAPASDPSLSEADSTVPAPLSPVARRSLRAYAAQSQGQDASGVGELPVAASPAPLVTEPLASASTDLAADVPAGAAEPPPSAPTADATPLGLAAPAVPMSPAVAASPRAAAPLAAALPSEAAASEIEQAAPGRLGLNRADLVVDAGGESVGLAITTIGPHVKVEASVQSELMADVLREGVDDLRSALEGHDLELDDLSFNAPDRERQSEHEAGEDEIAARDGDATPGTSDGPAATPSNGIRVIA